MLDTTELEQRSITYLGRKFQKMERLGSRQAQNSGLAFGDTLRGHNERPGSCFVTRRSVGEKETESRTSYIVRRFIRSGHCAESLVFSYLSLS